MEAVAEEASTSYLGSLSDRSDRLLCKAEAVLNKRSDRILLVLERCTDNQNYLACLRTAEILGVQNVWIVLSPRGGSKDEAAAAAAGGGAVDGFDDKAEVSRKRGRIARSCNQWLDVRTFGTTAECVAALRADGRTIWATDLAPVALLLDSTDVALPARLAVVMGREADGVSAEMLEAAHSRVALPMFGFNDSFNLSVATAVVLHHLFLACPEARGDLPPERKRALRVEWYSRLARTDAQRAEFLARVDDPPQPAADTRGRQDGAGQGTSPGEPMPKVARKEQAAGVAEERGPLPAAGNEEAGEGGGLE